MREISIRPYSEDDLDVVAAIWLDSWRSTGVQAPVTVPELRDGFQRAVARGWSVRVAALGAVVIGFSTLNADKLEQLFMPWISKAVVS